MSVRALLSDTGALRAPRTRWTTRRKVFVILITFLAGSLGFGLVLLGRYPMLRVVETGRTAEYPYLEPAAYPELPDVVFRRAVEAAGRLPGWRVTSADEDEGIFHVDVVSRPFFFKSEVTGTVRRDDGVTRVSLRSETVSANETIGDFGQNARNIRRFLKELGYAMAPAPRGDGP